MEATTIMPVMCKKCAKKQASFGMPGAKEKLWCGDCKEAGAERKGGMCVKCAKKVASFGMPGAKKSLWCGDCKEAGAERRFGMCMECGKTTAHHINPLNPAGKKCAVCKYCRDVATLTVGANSGALFGVASVVSRPALTFDRPDRQIH